MYTSRFTLRRKRKRYITLQGLLACKQRLTHISAVILAYGTLSNRNI